MLQSWQQCQESMAKGVGMSVYTHIKLTDVIPLLSALVLQVHTPHVSGAQVPRNTARLKHAI